MTLEEFLVQISANVLGTLPVAAGGYYLGKWVKAKQLRTKAHEYVHILREMINKGVQEGQAYARKNAKAIVSARDQLRDPLRSVDKLLNSNIDNLSDLLTKEASDEELLETMQVLKETWLSKDAQVEGAILKLFGHLGF